MGGTTGGAISREQELAYRDYFEDSNSMDPSDCFDAGWKAAQTRIRQLEKQCATLTAEVDRQQVVVEAAQQWRQGWNKRVATKYHELEQMVVRAVDAYEASRGALDGN